MHGLLPMGGWIKGRSPRQRLPPLGSRGQERLIGAESRTKTNRRLSSTGESLPTASWSTRPPMMTIMSFPCTNHTLEGSSSSIVLLEAGRGASSSFLMLAPMSHLVDLDATVQ